MKKTAFCFTALAFLSLLAFAQEEGYYGDSFARLTYVKGQVVVQRAGDLGSEEGVVNLALVEGDQLETGEGRAELSFGRKNFLRLDAGTVVELSNMPRQGDNRVRLHLHKGSVYLRLSFLEEEKAFELHTPDASFYALEEGLFRFDLRQNAETELSVIEGSMEAAGEAGSQLIGSRERLIASNGQIGSRSNLVYGRDDFDHWNTDRDALHSQYVSKRYLSSELEDYEYELAENGRWVYERPYGYVWVPRVYVEDWRPYYYGRWAWYPTCGWSWVSYEPWGWCTYHYGRWHWRLGLGWYWIPHHAWGPAWVHWYWGHDYYGWAPLSWYNYPVVVFNNYFYDRYHGVHYPGGSRALTVVHKSQLQNRRISNVALSRTDASRLGNLTMQAKQPEVRPTLRSSGLQKAVPSTSPRTSPQIRPSTLSRNSVGSRADSSSRISGSPGGQIGRTVSGDRASTSSSRVSPGSLSKSPSRVFTNYPAAPSSRSGTSASSRSRPESSGSIAVSPRQIRPYDSTQRRAVSSSSPPAIRSYSSSPRISSSFERSSSGVREDGPKVYSPDVRVTRYGTSSSLNSSRSSGPVRSFGSSQIRGHAPSGSLSSSIRSPFSRSNSSSSSSRSEAYSPLRSFSGSSSRSVFSAPKSTPSSRSFGSSSSRSSSSSSSVSRSSPRVSSSSRSAPSSSSRSSSSRSSSSGSVRRKN